MSNVSNDYLHNLIGDLSNNRQAQLRSIITNLLNNTNSNFPLMNNYVMSNSQISQQQHLNALLRNTLYAKPPYKKIISEKGEKQLKEVEYKKDKYSQTSCCITFEDFKENQKVILLPCNHLFEPNAIKTWLKEESNKCPICRYELDFKEIRDYNEVETPLEDIENETNSEEEDKEDEEDEEDVEELIELEDIEHRTNLLFNRYNSIFENIQQQTQPIINERTFIQNISGIENEFIESRAMQNAIIASLYEQSGEFNDSDNEEIELVNLYDTYDENH